MQIKTLWISLHGSPTFMRRVYLILIVLSVAEWAVAIFLGWVNSVAYVSHLSQLAITVSLLAPYGAARVEVKQDEGTADTEQIAEEDDR